MIFQSFYKIQFNHFTKSLQFVMLIQDSGMESVIVQMISQAVHMMAVIALKPQQPLLVHHFLDVNHEIVLLKSDLNKNICTCSSFQIANLIRSSEMDTAIK